MEEMIRRIVEMDRRAQAVLEDAQKEKLMAEPEIAEKSEQLKQRYLEQTRRRIQIDAENERTIFEQRWNKTQKYFDAQAEKLERQYREGHDQWLQSIYEAVTEPSR